MATKRKSRKPETPPEEPTEEVEIRRAPLPANRGVTGVAKTRVTVRANRPIAELDEKGEMQRYNKGDTFTLDAARARVLGNQVTITDE